MNAQRQVDLGMGRGLQPGGLAAKEPPEASETAEPTTSQAPVKRRQRSVTAIDPTSAIVVVDERAISDPSCMTIALQLQLDSALSEAEVLRQEVESYSKQVASKHSAVCILRQELRATAVQREELQLRNQKLQSDLTKEINRLQFELEYAQNNLADSQQTWSQRFDRVCQENQKLKAAMQSRDNELRFLVEERSGLLRDRDELLALLDADKRSQWLASAASPALAAPLASISGDNDIETAPPPAGPLLTSPEGRSAIELAVLGACTCPGCSPCRCAQAAARLKRQVVRAREEAVEARQRAEDAYVVVDAYRNAFEEQLARNRGLTLRLGHVTATGERGGRLRELVRWVGRQLSELGVPEARREGPNLRRASTIDDVGLGGRTSPTGSLCASSWSICESVLSQSGGPEDEGELRAMEIEPKPAEGNVMNDASQLTAEQLTMLLLDKLCERAEISAHQRLTARVLKRPGAACGGKRTTASTSSGVFSAASSST